MLYALFIIKSALEDFRRNKIRTFLTSLGILIGVASVVLLMAFGLGLKKYIQEQFESLGTNVLYVLPGNVIEDGQFQQGGFSVGNAFDDRDVSRLKKIEHVVAAVPFFQKVTKVQGDKDSKTYEITATTADVFSVMSLSVEHGKAFSKTDGEKGSKVIVVGPNVAKKIFGSVSRALGKSAKIEKISYKVIGITEAKGGGGLGAPSVDDSIYMPHKAAQSFNPDKKYQMIYLKAASQDVLPTIKKDAETTMKRRFEADEFSVVEQTEFLNAINSIFAIMNTVLVAIAAISLIVGGIGVMNIMYVSVVERIREIGIRRALGARKLDILFQFLAEAILLSLLGGILGLAISFLVVLLIQRYFPAYINIESVLLAVGVSSGIGIGFGVFPAKKAADLSPIEAIRHE